MAHPKGHHFPPRFRVALTTVIPGGKAIERLVALTVDACGPM